MRVVFVMLAALTAACAGAAGGLGDPNVRAKLRDLGLQACEASGVPSPRTMVAVASPDHQAAEQVVSGSIVNDHAPVYVVAMTGGRFAANSSPPGVPVPQGNVLTLTVAAESFSVMDVGISDNAPDLTRIDPDVVDLLAK